MPTFLPPSSNASVARWSIPLYGGFIVGLMVTSLACRPATVDQPSEASSDLRATDSVDPAQSSGPVTIVVVHHDSERTLVIDDVPDGETLETVMRGASELEPVISGSGASAFLSSLSGQENEGERGWTFLVDDKFATQGIGSTPLHPPTTVRWQFATMDEANP